MNALLKAALTREGELVTRQGELAAESKANEAELVEVRRVIQFYKNGAKREALLTGHENGVLTITALVKEAYRKRQGDFDKFDIKRDIEQSRPSLVVSAKQINRALYKLYERKHLKITVKGKGKQASRYAKP